MGITPPGAAVSEMLAGDRQGEAGPSRLGCGWTVSGLGAQSSAGPLQCHAVPGVQAEVQGEPAALRCDGCHRAVLCWTPGHAVAHQEPAVQARAHHRCWLEGAGGTRGLQGGVQGRGRAQGWESSRPRWLLVSFLPCLHTVCLIFLSSLPSLPHHLCCGGQMCVCVCVCAHAYMHIRVNVLVSGLRMCVYTHVYV